MHSRHQLMSVHMHIQNIDMHAHDPRAALITVLAVNTPDVLSRGITVSVHTTSIIHIYCMARAPWMQPT
jgi:hypothetical protein